jgi:hypothetical protein
MSQPVNNVPNIEGLIYLLNQVGLALAQANARIAALEATLNEFKVSDNGAAQPSAETRAAR